MKPVCHPALALVAFALVAAPLPARAGEVIDRILVRVNSRIVPQSLLNSRLEQAVRDAGGSMDFARRETLKKSVLDELVNEALLEDRARDLDVMTTDAEVEEQIRRLKEQNQVKTDEEFAQGLAASGLTLDRLRDQLRKTLTVQRVVGREVNSKVDLSDDALRIIYEREKDTWRVPERAHLAEVLIANGDDATSREWVARRAKEASDKVKGGAKWEAVVKEYSDGSTKGKNGDLGFVSRGDLNQEIDRIVFSLPQGSVSDPIQTRFGWHIVKVIEKFPPSWKPFSEVKTEILKREQETQFQKKLVEYLDKLKQDAVIRVSAEASPYYEVKTPPAPAPAKDPKKG